MKKKSKNQLKTPAKRQVKTKAPVAPAAPAAPKLKKCRAYEMGHRSCHCGREGCGELVTNCAR